MAVIGRRPDIWSALPGGCRFEGFPWNDEGVRLRMSRRTCRNAPLPVDEGEGAGYVFAVRRIELDEDSSL